MMYGLPAGLLAGACPTRWPGCCSSRRRAGPLDRPGGGRGGRLAAPAPRSAGLVGAVAVAAAAPSARGTGGRVAAMRLALGDAEFDVTHRALVMGILNRTPDSFYDAGATSTSTRSWPRPMSSSPTAPTSSTSAASRRGPEPVSEAEELDRVVPAVEALRARFDVPVSVDTWRASVLDAAFAAGASVGNDISGFADPDYLPVAARPARRWSPPTSGSRPGWPILIRSTPTASSRPSCASAPSGRQGGGGRHPARADHGRRRPRPRQDRAHVARAAPGVRPPRRARLPGVPVGLEQAVPRGAPRPAVDERRLASVAAHAQGIALGCRVLRAHDVRGSRRVADVMAAVLEAQGLRPERSWLSCTSSTAPTRRSSARRPPTRPPSRRRRRSVADGRRPDARRRRRHRRPRGGRGADARRS